MAWHSQPIFVYGTLKKGQPNYYYLQEAMDKGQAEFLGAVQTVDRWPLIVDTHYNIPFLLYSKGTGEV